MMQHLLCPYQKNVVEYHLYWLLFYYQLFDIIDLKMHSWTLWVKESALDSEKCFVFCCRLRADTDLLPILYSEVVRSSFRYSYIDSWNWRLIEIGFRIDVHNRDWIYWPTKMFSCGLNFLWLVKWLSFDSYYLFMFENVSLGDVLYSFLYFTMLPPCKLHKFMWSWSCIYFLFMYTLWLHFFINKAQL